MMIITNESHHQSKLSFLGHLGGLVVEYLPLAQVVIPGFWDRVPHQAIRRELASLSVSASLCLSGINKIFKKDYGDNILTILKITRVFEL